MKLLQRYLMRQFIPVCLVAALFFIMLLEMGDLFANLWKYLSNDVPGTSILKLMWLYLPKCLSFSMPMSILFASSYTMGNMYARNELTSIFAAGYPLYRLIVPMLILGLALSFGMFFFEDRVVIHTLAEKNVLGRLLLKQEQSLSNTNVVVLSGSGTVVYTADYYQEADKKLYSLLVVLRSPDGSVNTVIQSPVATWSGSEWIPDDPVVYALSDPEKVSVTRGHIPLTLDEPPETFRKNIVSVDELSAKDAKLFIAGERKAGLPYTEQLSNYYKRFSFPFTIFIVLFFSISLGGRFKKNIMLMSLLLSLSVAVLYYVTQMITMLFAKWEYISPLAGAWFPVILFIGASAVILRSART
jgi:Predicted permeases